MDKRKDAILGFLKARGQASLADVATHLEVSKQGALRHIEALLQEGLVEKGNETHDGPGRPEHSYRLTDAAAEHFPHAHRELAGERVKLMGAARLKRFFPDRAARTGARVGPQLPGPGFKRRGNGTGGWVSRTATMPEGWDKGWAAWRSDQ